MSTSGVLDNHTQICDDSYLTLICSGVGVAQNCSTKGHNLSGASFLKICFLFGRDSSIEFLNLDYYRA